MFNGQSSILALEKDYDYLYRLLCFKGGLQKIIKIILNDNYLKEDGELFYSEYIYLKLCACVYGSDEAKTIEVLDFIKQKVGDDLFACSKYEIAELETIKSKADAFLGSRFPLYEKLKGCTNCPDDLDSGDVYKRQVIHPAQIVLRVGISLIRCKAVPLDRLFKDIQKGCLLYTSRCV